MSKHLMLLLSLSCYAVFSQATVSEPVALPPSNIAPAPYYFDHPSHVIPPVHTPTHPPACPPPAHSYPPEQAPVHPPIQPQPRKFIAVQGFVYCKSCLYSGNNTLLGAQPIVGAYVKLRCNSTKLPVVVTGKTNKHGYFFIQAPETITTYGFRSCRLFLVSSPLANCNKPSNFRDGVVGAALRRGKSFFSNERPFLLYTLGPFFYVPTCPRE